MKNNIFASTLFTITLASLIIYSGCKKHTIIPQYNPDKSALISLIDSATNLLNSIQEGNKPGDYAPGSKDTLLVTINLAIQVKNQNIYTQQQVDNTVSNLRRVIEFVKSRVIQEVSQANLVAQWKFDGNTNDATGNGHNGKLESGWIGTDASNAILGNTLPQPTTDRFGRRDMAYYFAKGSYIEVPYDRALNPQSFTISLWVNVDTIYAGNYMLSLNRWNGYKFQLQSNNFLFLTVNTDQGIHDVDDNPGTVPLHTWTHVAVSYTSGMLKFYINGEVVKTVQVLGNPITLSSPVNLVIGNELPKETYNFTDPNNPNYFWGANYFTGSLDDIRFYNTALSDADIYSIYLIEKSL
ncbi:concanavalin A-like lectin/glucanase superfamily protein [Thermoflavifilum aggregans]|uniref:Concanavalin A-like lectin/glucanase superfamily protein n=1 Tax=Thermoflavifilum aggregans TaxID=454188 RepID=A0A2M9CV78_9BACT|nr:LamG domain-containing protein [Thermoflavifilum aggregans]PJJ75824.1 concanavalin A-like lectin/glucanase superfamily protein [Thermoflavifilum aggregans]